MSILSYKSKKVDIEGKSCWIGIDVHKSTYYVALLSSDGLSYQFSIPSTPQVLFSKLEALRIEILGISHESGPTGYELAWYCQDKGHPITVAAASKIPRPISNGAKTDRLDGMKLAEYLSKDMLKGITIPTREEHGLREIERRRQQLSRSQGKLRQQIKSFLLKNDISVPSLTSSWSKSAMRELHSIALSTHLRIALDSYLEQLDFISKQIKSISQSLLEASLQLGKGEQLKNLRSIPGVGKVVAQTFVAEIFRPERFERAEEISAYVGLAPIVSQSGQGKSRAQIRFVGQQYLRSLLIEAAWVLIRYEPYFRNFYNKIYLKTNLPQKAIVAVARKLLTVIWRVSVENRKYKSALS